MAAPHNEKREKQRAQRRKKRAPKGKHHGNFAAFLYETVYEIVTWVLIALAVGGIFFFASKDDMRWVFWSVISLIVLIIVMIGLVADRHYFQRAAPAPKDDDAPQISVVSEVWFHVARRNAPFYFFVYQYGGRVIRSPVHDLIYVRLTNTGRLPFMIDYLGVEISNDDKKWIPAFLLDVFHNPALKVTTIEPGTPSPRLTVPSTSGPTDALQYETAKPRLRDVVKDRNVGPGETVKGWLFIERPDGFDAKGMYRLKVRNLNGDQAVGTISQMKHIENGFAGTDFTVVANHVDLTKIPLCYYSERDKLTER